MISHDEHQLRETHKELVKEFKQLLQLKLHVVTECATPADIKRVYYSSVPVAIFFPWISFRRRVCVPLPGQEKGSAEYFVTSHGHLAAYFVIGTLRPVRRFYYVHPADLPLNDLQNA
ncbi:MAG: hypothetical protein JWM07_356, partial [Candidatus Saccharibacteria bacterium]|nr:hypothetical protein [Candidatus Saccharibacteria bacterium]